MFHRLSTIESFTSATISVALGSDHQVLSSQTRDFPLQDSLKVAGRRVATTGARVISMGDPSVATGGRIIVTGRRVLSIGCSAISTHTPVVKTRRPVIVTGARVISTHRRVILMGKFCRFEPGTDVLAADSCGTSPEIQCCVADTQGQKDPLV